LIDLKLDKTVIPLGGHLKLTCSFKAPAERTSVVLSIGIIRPDEAKEYPLYLQRFPIPPAEGTSGATYISKAMGWHKAFAHIYIYKNTEIIENELTPFLTFFVGPTIGPIIPTLPPKE